MSIRPADWPRVREVFEAALAAPATEQRAYVTAACGDDGALLAAVEQLLASHDRAGSFLETPANATISDIGETTGTTTFQGRRIGPYQITAWIGAGGMGEVYRARDAKLGRDVAIKILPTAFTSDPDRLARFEREARMLAALNHPHIGAIYGFEESDGIAALVLELVEGATLMNCLAGGPVLLDEALAIARQIADALDAAHERGIIHRDLKPANVKLTPDGTIKVLDFGLAKVGPELQASPSPTMDSRESVIAGTAPYMSPEQARGGRVDKRADIWAFGCVLYELLAGVSAFPGETTTDALAAIVNLEPDWTLLPAATPANIRRLLRRCLEKDPKRRLRDIGDARVELDEAFAPPVTPAAVRTRWARTRAAAVMMGVALVASAIVFWLGRVSVAQPPSPTVRVHRLTDWAGVEATPAISPDGRAVAFVSSGGGSRQIWVRLVAGGTPLQLTRDGGDHLFPRWSPDSNTILYYSSPGEHEASGALWEVPALGGPARRLVGSSGGADVSHDGSRLAFFRFEGGRAELVVATRDGSNARSIAQLDVGYDYLSPRWSPDDQLIAYQRSAGATPGRDVFVVDARGTAPRAITRDATVQEGFAWSPDSSRIVFSSGRGATIRYLPTLNLWSVRPDGGDLRQLTFGEASYASPDVKQSGAIVVSRVRIKSDIWRIPVDGPPHENAAAAVRVTKQTSLVHAPSVSPDGREGAYVSDAGTHGNIWVRSLATGESRKITDEQTPDLMVGLPLWSPTGGQIAYFTALRDSLNYWVLNPDGSNRRLLAPNAGWAVWSPDGQWLYYAENPGGRVLKKVPAGGGDPITVRSDTATRPALSPDGRTLYYVIEMPLWAGGSDYEIRAAMPETSAGRVLARIRGSRAPILTQLHPVVSPDGQWLALPLLDDPAMNLWALSTATGEMRQVTDFGERAISIARRVSWAPDGHSIFAAIAEQDADIVLLEGLSTR